MDLKEYLIREQRSIRWFASKIGCHYQTLHKIMQGKCMARPSLCDKIKEFTNGEVKIKPPPNKICPHCQLPLKRRLRTLSQKQIDVKKDIVSN